MQIIAPCTWGQQIIAQIIHKLWLKCIEQLFSQNFMTQFELTKTYFFNLEKYIEFAKNN